MISFQLFAVVFALFFWDGRALECAYKKKSPEFCRRVNESFQLNNSSQYLLVGDKFKEDREIIARANENVLTVLKKETESDLRPALYYALDSETMAVFRVRVSCSGPEGKTDACKIGLSPLCLATEELVNATMVIVTEEQKQEILDAYKVYYKEEAKQNRTVWADAAYTLGTAVMKIIEDSMSHNVPSA